MILNSHTCRKKERKKERKNIYKEKGLEVEREGRARGQKLITPGKKHITRFDSEMLVATCLRTIVNIGSKRQRNYGVFPVVHTNPFLLLWWW
jgi:hypothetical protein